MKNQSGIRNFVIISHVNHGKSTLADRFLELTKTIPKEKMQPQFLDMMDLEREKGITIKMQPVRMLWHPNRTFDNLRLTNDKLNQKSKVKGQELSNSKQEFVLNLIDTPGHVDFSYEVSRSLAAVEGAILLVDATKGIQAQTIANLELAKKQNLLIIPAVNKIDLLTRIEETTENLANLLDVDKKEVIKISAKYGTNVEQVLEAIIKKIPPPETNFKKPFRALIFDLKYDPYKGVIAFVRVVDGKIKNGQSIYLIAQKTEGKIKELGYFRPEFSPKEELLAGEIGYLATGIKEPAKVRPGETIIKIQNSKFKVQNIEPLPGYSEPKPMVFANLYSQDPDDFELLKGALEKLKLNDPSLTFKLDYKEGLGRGFGCGFLGLLHTEIIVERLKREFGLNLILSTPSVIYKILTIDKKEILIYTPSDWPSTSKIKEIQEPRAKIQVLTPLNYLGLIQELFKTFESKHLKTSYFQKEKLELIYETPLRVIITQNLYDKLKSLSQGFASMNYEILDYRSSDLVKLDILILGKKEETFSKIVPRSIANKEARKMVEKLKEILPPQQFSVPIQAAISGKIIARETIKTKRKDVTAPFYGGDYTRKRKLLEKQKKGKERLRERGEIRIPSKVFLEMFKEG